MCIKTGKIVSFNGPFECGSWPDLKIFRSRLKGMLSVGEKMIADCGYRGDARILLQTKREMQTITMQWTKLMLGMKQSMAG
jgi:hypothetical protein